MNTSRHASPPAPSGRGGSAGTGREPIRIFIVDDHPLVRDGLKARVAQETGLEICGEADSAEAAIATWQGHRPNVLVIDLGLKDMHGLRLIECIRSRDPEIRILVLSAYSEALYGERALRSGADSYVSKQQPPESIIEAIRTTAAGRRYLSQELADRMVSLAVGVHRDGSHALRELSRRELEVFELIGNGKSTRDIAAQLGVSVHTVETHREKLRVKLALDNGRELVQAAVRWVIENR
jgi:DNA-binding NarL/FixJ family response regulator